MTRVVSFFLCFVAMVDVPVGCDSWLPSLAMLLVLIVLVLAWSRWCLRKSEEDYRSVPCPACG